MNIQNTIAGLQTMEFAIKELTADINDIWTKNGADCEAPEFMTEPYKTQWSNLWKQRKAVYDYHARISSIIDDFARFYHQDLK